MLPVSGIHHYRERFNDQARMAPMAGDLIVENCRIPGEGSRRHRIVVEEGKIQEIGECGGRPPRGSLDAEGRILAAGYIDLHIQGAGGADVLDGTSSAIRTISSTCARFGVTGFLATTVYRPDGDNEHLSTVAKEVDEDLGGAKLLGIHLEGPFISPARRGMIQPASICPPDQAVLDRILDATRGKLRMMTIAPEIEGNSEIVRRLVESHVTASFGHSDATYDDTRRALGSGVSHVTHLFNAMPPLHHRRPGPLLAILESGASVQIIPDGVHIHREVIRWAVEQLGVGRVIPITDGIRAMGLSEGEYTYDGVEFRAEGGAARYRDGTLIGTTLGMNELVRRLAAFAGLQREEAISAASRNPARVLGLEGQKGTLAVGRDADMVLLDDDLGVWATIVGGRPVYVRE